MKEKGATFKEYSEWRIKFNEATDPSFPDSFEKFSGSNKKQEDPSGIVQVDVLSEMTETKIVQDHMAKVALRAIVREIGRVPSDEEIRSILDELGPLAKRLSQFPTEFKYLL